MTASAISTEDFFRLLREGLPTGASMNVEVVRLERGRAVMRMTTNASHLRPGGTVAGPVLFGLADVVLYAAVMSIIGPVPLAVTTDATMHFLRRPRAGVLVASGTILKEGKRLIVGEATIAHDGEEDAPVAHAVMTYSVPPR